MKSKLSLGLSLAFSGCVMAADKPVDPLECVAYTKIAIASSSAVSLDPKQKVEMDNVLSYFDAAAKQRGGGAYPDFGTMAAANVDRAVERDPENAHYYRTRHFYMPCRLEYKRTMGIK